MKVSKCLNKRCPMLRYYKKRGQFLCTEPMFKFMSFLCRSQQLVEEVTAAECLRRRIKNGPLFRRWFLKKIKKGGNNGK